MNTSANLRVVWVSVDDADAFLTWHYRHHPPPAGALFALGIARASEDRLLGAIIAGRPVPPAQDDGATVEITRVGTDGSPHVEVALYRAVWKVVRACGYHCLITHTHVGQIRLGLRQVGVRPVAALPPRAGSHTPRRARTDRGVDGVCRTRWGAVESGGRNAGTGRCGSSHTSAASARHRTDGQERSAA
jgi:hypothetical protein